MAMILALPFIVQFAELVWQININYPPTLEQLNLGVHTPLALWAVRLVSLGLLLAASLFYSRLTSIKIRPYFWIFILASPVFSLLWMSYPLDALRIFILAGIFWFIARYQKIWLAAAAAGVFILILNLGIFKQNPKIVETLSQKRSQEEVLLRFNAEDTLKPNIGIPLKFKRIGYNKYFTMLKNSLNESLAFFDFETIFFQEVHPMEQKGFVMFYWPQVFIFALGLWWILTGKAKSEKVIIPLLAVSFAYFLTSSTTPERRLILTIYPMTIIMSAFLEKALSKKTKLQRMVAVLLIALTLYGWATNYYDRYVRPDYWLDNRPIAYDFFFSYLKNESEEYGRILVPETLYSVKEYCKFYLKDCARFEIENFDLSKQKADKDTLYIGFAGNFLGPNPDNSFPQNPDIELNKTGLEILQKTRVLNNIANGYGQDLLIARMK